MRRTHYSPSQDFLRRRDEMLSVAGCLIRLIAIAATSAVVGLVWWLVS